MVYCLDHSAFFNVNRHSFVSGEDSAVSDNGVFIGDYAVKIRVIAYNGILEQNGVFNDCAFSDLNASEKDAVINGTLNNATVSYERIGYG